MVLEDALRWIQIILSVGLVILILLQAAGGGAGTLFGNTGSAIQKTRRGLEKTLFQWTIICAAGFLLVAIIQLLIL